MKVKTLKGRKQITAAFRRGKRFVSDSFIVHVLDRSYAGDSDAPIGGQKDLFVICAVRKKQVPLAVTRNRIKRILRECVRSHARNHQTVPFMTLAFVWQKPMGHSKEVQTIDIKPSVHDALNQAMQYFANNERKEARR